ncbi:hypothetical protein BELL_0070g00040 [Botrytis elliptica]|uniref:Uncharacterized protein n=1 Tax=Botrytis elliptica TaxID=278938 RepID=A0A4Z1JWK8_9HELO|nr:hypothetical protein EAE99_010526 [Botrytis elliptica]TGO78319.1 hypothetical protein BELL_0070g00040 [Botrytis elliptica]
MACMGKQDNGTNACGLSGFLMAVSDTLELRKLPGGTIFRETSDIAIWDKYPGDMRPEKEILLAITHHPIQLIICIPESRPLNTHTGRYYTKIKHLNNIGADKKNTTRKPQASMKQCNSAFLVTLAVILWKSRTKQITPCVLYITIYMKIESQTLPILIVELQFGQVVAGNQEF